LNSMLVKEVKCRYGRWLIDGNSHVPLFDTSSQYHHINHSIVFGYIVAWFL
ncbi:hypothetical protein BJY52DRAFT_1101152, partial [Lactarius psammicola]